MLSQAQVDQWLQDGFVAVTGLWPEGLIEAAAATAAALHPYEEVSKNKRGFSEMPWLSAPPKGVGYPADPKRAENAAPENPLNHMTVHPRVIKAVAQLLETPVRLTSTCSLATHFLIHI